MTPNPPPALREAAETALGRLEGLLSGDGYRMEPEYAAIRRALALLHPQPPAPGGGPDLEGLKSELRDMVKRILGDQYSTMKWSPIEAAITRTAAALGTTPRVPACPECGFPLLHGSDADYCDTDGCSLRMKDVPPPTPSKETPT